MTWDTGESAVDGHLRRATEDEIPDPPTERTVPDLETLEQGDTYPGPIRGYEFSVDANGQPFEKDDGRKYITDEDYKEIATVVHDLKGGGKVRVNKANHALTRVDGKMIFLGVVASPSELTYEQESGGITEEPDIDFDDF